MSSNSFELVSVEENSNKEGPSCEYKGLGHLGSTNNAGQAIVDEPEINSLEELWFMMDEDVETLCCNIK